MRKPLLIAAITLAGGALLTGVAWISHAGPDSGLDAGSRQAAEAADRSRGGSVWGADYFPNIPLVTHEGERVRFFDDLIEDKVVAINFMYTSCPDTCPVETARMLQVARLLGDRLGKDVFFYSITIEPEHDTQEVLEAFARSWRIPEGWTFLTGDYNDITRLRRKLGMRIDDVRTGDLAEHTVNLLIGNQRTGRWMKRSPFENAHVLASQIGNWLHEFKMPSQKSLDYGDAPELRQITDGEYLFRNRCSACHTIGAGDIRNAKYHQIGPDLFNVTMQRDREWLERWIAEPDAMLEEKDPLAVALYEQWERVPMPNMRLSEKDVRSILGYIEEESVRVTAVRAAREADPSTMDHGKMDHSKMDHSAMDHGATDHGATDHDARAHGDPPAIH